MILIAKNKIIEYIDKHPEARITLLLWLKEYPYTQEQRMFLDREGKPIQGISAGSAQPDFGFYIIKFSINYAAKVSFITWIGTRQEHEEEYEREFKELQRKHPDVERVVKVATITLNGPNQKSFEQFLESSQTTVNLSAASLLPADTDAITKPDLNTDLFNEQKFKTEAAYKQGLLRMIEIFNAEPETQEFDELLTLLHLIKHYEEYELTYPELQAFEVVTHRMDMFKTTALDLATMSGSRDIDQFLLGKQALAPQIIAKFYKPLGIKFPVDDQLFHS